jgi:hypothetical protein
MQDSKTFMAWNLFDHTGVLLSSIVLI